MESGRGSCGRSVVFCSSIVWLPSEAGRAAYCLLQQQFPSVVILYTAQSGRWSTEIERVCSLGVCSCYLGGKSWCRSVVWREARNPRCFFIQGVELCLRVLLLPRRTNLGSN